MVCRSRACRPRLVASSPACPRGPDDRAATAAPRVPDGHGRRTAAGDRPDCGPRHRPPVHDRQLRRHRGWPRRVRRALGCRSATTETAQFFHGLRERVDAVMAGTGTLRTERYGRITRDPERRRRRVSRGPAPGADRGRDIAQRGGPDRHPAVRRARGQGRGVHARASSTRRAARPRSRSSGSTPSRLTMTTALRHLKAEHGVRTAAMRGRPDRVRGVAARGPRRRAVLDDLAEAGRRRHGADDHQRSELPELLDLDLRWAVEHEGSLFLRYATR